MRITDKLWITKELRKMLKSNKSYTKPRRIQMILQLKLTTHDIKYILPLCLKEAESSYYHGLFTETKTSTFNLWKHLGPIINPGKGIKRDVMNKIMNDGQRFINAQGIANSMNHFVKLETKHYRNRFQILVTYKMFLPQTVTQTLYLTPVTPEEFIARDSNIKSSQSRGLW